MAPVAVGLGVVVVVDDAAGVGGVAGHARVRQEFRGAVSRCAAGVRTGGGRLDAAGAPRFLASPRFDGAGVVARFPFLAGVGYGVSARRGVGTVGGRLPAGVRRGRGGVCAVNAGGGVDVDMLRGCRVSVIFAAAKFLPLVSRFSSALSLFLA